MRSNQVNHVRQKSWVKNVNENEHPTAEEINRAQIVQNSHTENEPLSADAG